MSSRAVFVSDDKGNVLAYDRAAGANLWKQDKLANRKLTRPLAVNNLLVVGDFEGQVHVLRQDDGAIVGRFATDCTANVAAPPVRPKSVFSPSCAASPFIWSSVTGMFKALSFATVATGSPFRFMLKYKPGSSVQAAMRAMIATNDSKHIAP